jgi:hypothetical protein
MAYDRYTCICEPIKSCSWTSKRASFGIVIAWILAAMIASPQLYIFKVELVTMNNIQFETCYVKWNHPFFEGFYIFFHVICQFILPFVILLFLYLSIFLAVSNSVSIKKASFEAVKEYSDIIPSRDSSLKSNINLNFDMYSKSHEAVIKRSLIKLIVPCFCKNEQKKTNYDKENNLVETGSIMLEKDKDEQKHSKLFGNSTEETRPRKSYLKIFKQSKSIPIRQNLPVAKVLSKSKMKTLKLTLTVVIAYVLCSLPFYIATLIQFFFGSQMKKYSIGCKYSIGWMYVLIKMKT